MHGSLKPELLERSFHGHDFPQKHACIQAPVWSLRSYNITACRPSSCLRFFFFFKSDATICLCTCVKSFFPRVHSEVTTVRWPIKFYNRLIKLHRHTILFLCCGFYVLCKRLCGCNLILKLWNLVLPLPIVVIDLKKKNITQSLSATQYHSVENSGSGRSSANLSTTVSRLVCDSA